MLNRTFVAHCRAWFDGLQAGNINEVKLQL